VYLCTTDADLKLYTSLKYCIAVIKPQTQAEKEWEARTQGMTRPTGGVGRQFKGEVLMGVPFKGERLGRARQEPGFRVVPEDLAAYEIPELLRKQRPDTDDEK
jgi:hypothetical protein